MTTAHLAKDIDKAKREHMQKTALIVAGSLSKLPLGRDEWPYRSRRTNEEELPL